MSNKYTPGPWTVGEYDPLTVNGADGRVAAADFQNARQLANARLIAAAPELLEALRPFTTVPCERRGNIHCVMLPSDSGVKICAPCAARAAIAKAVQS
jgi:hypothetical protein